MASIGNDPNGRKRILFIAGDGKRKTIRLGKVSMRQAEAFKVKLESLVGERITGTADDEVSRWVAAMDDETHAKLAAVELVKPRIPVNDRTLGKFTEDFIARMTTSKPNTIIAIKQVQRWLKKFFGADRDMRTITADQAHAFRDFMATEGLSENSLRRHIGRSRQMFERAIELGIVRGKNPFKGIAATVRGNKARQFFVTQAMANAAIEAAPDVQWRVLIALSRYGGVRMPSEALPLRWGDINWEKRRVLITSPKTEHHAGHETRFIPLFPELEKYLLQAHSEAEEGAEYVITRYRDSTSNLRTQFNRIIKKAGMKPWPRLWHNMRASRQTELSENNPAHAVCAWLGNSQRVASEHYLQVTDEHYERAAQNAAQQPSGEARNSGKSDSDFVENPPEIPVLAGVCESLQIDQCSRQGSNLQP